jgi:sulfide:quinone oxidoreductase
MRKTLILGAGFAGLELSTTLSETFGDDADVTLIDGGDAFVFGFSKLDVMFGKATLDAVRLPYAAFRKPGVSFLRERVVAIDPARRRVTTDRGVHEADFLVIALGADYDFGATPGLVEAGNEFYSVAGAARLRDILPTFKGGHAIVGVCGAPFKCPPAPSEAALMLHDYLVLHGVREASDITLVMPFGSPVPPSPDTSKALVTAFAERGIRFVPGRRVASLDGARRVAILDDGSERPYDLFLGVPKHHAPAVVREAGMTEGGWVPVNPRTLETHFAGVYACGDLANTGTPKAGVFAEGAARTVAAAIIAARRDETSAGQYGGAGSCYIEFGAGRIARVDVDFFSGPAPTGTFQAPSTKLRIEKQRFGSDRRSRWFGL